jgi:hypothetical protein
VLATRRLIALAILHPFYFSNALRNWVRAVRARLVAAMAAHTTINVRVRVRVRVSRYGYYLQKVYGSKRAACKSSSVGKWSKS